MLFNRWPGAMVKATAKSGRMSGKRGLVLNLEVRALRQMQTVKSKSQIDVLPVRAHVRFEDGNEMLLPLSQLKITNNPDQKLLFPPLDVR